MTPFLLRFLSQHSNRRKPLMWMGVAVCTAATLGAAFAQTVSTHKDLRQHDIHI